MGVYAIWMRMVGITTGLFKTLIFDVFLKKLTQKEQYSFGLTLLAFVFSLFASLSLLWFYVTKFMVTYFFKEKFFISDLAVFLFATSVFLSCWKEVLHLILLSNYGSKFLMKNYFHGSLLCCFFSALLIGVFLELSWYPSCLSRFKHRDDPPPFVQKKLSLARC